MLNAAANSALASESDDIAVAHPLTGHSGDASELADSVQGRSKRAHPVRRCHGQRRQVLAADSKANQGGVVHVHA